MPKHALLLGALLLSTSLAAQTTPLSDAPLANVTLRSIRFDDTVGLPKAVEQEIARSITSRHYGAKYASEIPELVRDGLQRHGYFKAMIGNPAFKVIEQTPTLVIVEASVVIDPGPLYYLRSIDFANATAFVAAEMRRQFPLHDGDTFNIEAARIGIKGLKDLYMTKGYVNFTPIPDFTFDEPAHALTMKVDIDEGAQYRVGRLVVLGDESEPGAKERLLKAWEKYEGTYRADAMELVLQDLHARPSLPLYKMVEISQDNQQHVLTYHLTLGKPHRLSFAP